ncbi:MAG: hypothetical protein JST59_22500 [Actinobacteria bacterium]|nr:hypothetical protein [Actinomycetota bacterium]
MDVNGLDPIAINLLLHGRVPTLAAEIARGVGVTLAFAACVDDPLRRADIVGEALGRLRYFVARFGRRSPVCDRVVAELEEAGDGSRGVPDAKTLRQHARTLDAHARTLDGLVDGPERSSGCCRGPAEGTKGQAASASNGNEPVGGGHDAKDHLVRNTYTVTVTRYRSFAGDDSGYFATVIGHETGYGFEPHSVTGITPAPTAWAPAEEEAVAKAIRASAKERSIAALAVTAAEAGRLRNVLVESIPEPPSSPDRARERAIALSDLAGAHRVRPEDATPEGHSLKVCLEYPDSICQWVAVTGLGAGRVRLRPDYSDAASALGFMSALTDGEEAAVRIGRDEADELPIEIVDLDYGRAIKCHYGLRWSTGDVPAS